MRHIGEEFGLVLGRQGQLFSPFLHGELGQLDLAILHVDGRFLGRQFARLLLQLLVGLFQLLLLLLHELLGGTQRCGCDLDFCGIVVFENIENLVELPHYLLEVGNILLPHFALVRRRVYLANHLEHCSERFRSVQVVA